MLPQLSEPAWALLGVLHRARHGGPQPPAGFVEEYAELRKRRLVVDTPARETQINDAGEAALHERYGS
jgi:hypothetical protein